MDAEGRRIVIRMSAFVRLRDHELRFESFEKFGQTKRDREELMGRLLIGEAELDYAILGNAGERECRYTFFPASFGVIVPRREASVLRIQHVSGRAVRNMNNTSVRKT